MRLTCFSSPSRVAFFVSAWLAAIACMPSRADVFSEVTQGYGRKIESRYFGVHLHRLVLSPGEQAVSTSWPSVAFGAIRLWDSVTRWADVAPAAGQWNFTRMDTYVQAATHHRLAVLYTLGSTPAWMSSRPSEICPYGHGCGAEPVRMAHWEEYVRRVSTRYGNRIAAYELWNEPYFSDVPRDKGRTGFYTGSIEAMVEMARIARRVLDEIVPGTPLCSPGFVNGPDRLELFLAAGGKQHIQAICYHFYAESDAYFAGQLRDLRAVMKRQGVAHLPLWNTEAGVETLKPSDPHSGIATRNRETSMQRLTQMLILGAAGGLQHFYYYAWDNDLMGVVTRAGETLPGVAILTRLRGWLVGATTGSCAKEDEVVRCALERDGERYLIAWFGEGRAARRLTLPPGLRVASAESVDPMLPAPITEARGARVSLLIAGTPILIRLGVNAK